MRSRDPNTRVFYVYQLRLENQSEPFYVGKGKNGRAYDHFAATHHHSLKNHIIKKASREGVRVHVEFVKESMTEPEAWKLEAELIAQYGRRDLKTGCLANLTMGGEGAAGYVFTEEQRAHISRKVRARGPVSDETRRKLSAVPRSEEWRAKHGAANAQRIVTAETKQKLRDHNTGKSQTHAQKVYNSLINKGRPKPREWVELVKQLAVLKRNPLSKSAYVKALREKNPAFTLIEYVTHADHAVRMPRSTFKCKACGVQVTSNTFAMQLGKSPDGHVSCVKNYKR